MTARSGMLRGAEVVRHYGDPVAEYEAATREVLACIQEHVEGVCLITHRRDLMPMVDASLVLSQNGGGVVVEVVR